MGFLDRLLGRSPAKHTAPPSRGPHSVAGGHAPSTRSGVSSPQQVRKELVRVCTREMLLHNGIPLDWARVEPLTTAQAGRDTGVHVRLVVLHWDPRLMLHAVALQDHLQDRIRALDPTADQWLMGVSWQFALKDPGACPPLPHPGSWTAQPPAVAGGPAAPVPGGAGGISGPTPIPSGPARTDPRRELERMLGERDAAFGKGKDDGFGKTQPMGFDKTQPMGIDHRPEPIRPD